MAVMQSSNGLCDSWDDLLLVLSGWLSSRSLAAIARFRSIILYFFFASVSRMGFSAKLGDHIMNKVLR